MGNLPPKPKAHAGLKVIRSKVSSTVVIIKGLVKLGLSLFLKAPPLDQPPLNQATRLGTAKRRSSGTDEFTSFYQSLSLSFLLDSSNSQSKESFLSDTEDGKRE
jgi:hypothetical protein